MKKIMTAVYSMNKQRKVVPIAFPTRKARKEHILKSNERPGKRKEMID